MIVVSGEKIFRADTDTVTLNIFYCSIRNNWIGHKFYNLETSSPIHTDTVRSLMEVTDFSSFIGQAITQTNLI
jgi:hypothetical protein